MAAEMRLARDGAQYAERDFAMHYGEVVGAARWAEATPARVGTAADGAIVPVRASQQMAADLAPSGEGFFLDGDAFMIGAESYGYMYMATTATWHGYPMYQCHRGRDSKPGVLFLMFTGARWEAGHVAEPAPNSATEVAQRMQPAFRGPVGEDIRAAGRHLWECFDERRGTWWQPSSFRTTALQGLE